MDMFQRQGAQNIELSLSNHKFKSALKCTVWFETDRRTNIMAIAPFVLRNASRA